MADEPDSTEDTETPAPGASLATAAAEPASVPTAPVDWRTGLPPDLQTDKTLSQIKDVPTLAKAYVDAQKMVGGSIRLPGEKATPEERQKILDDVYAKLGRPENADGYQIAHPPLPEGATWDERGESLMRGAMHQAGLNTRQAQLMYDTYARMIEGQARELVVRNLQGQVESVKALKQEWGPAYNRNLDLVHQVVHTRADDALRSMLDATGLGNHPLIVRAFLALAEQDAEDGIIAGDVMGVTAPGIAQVKLDEILGNPNHPYWKGDPEAVEHVQGLRKLIHGTKAVATIG